MRKCTKEERETMAIRPDIVVRLFSDEEKNTAVTIHPRKCVIKSKFGAGDRRCWVELYNEDLFLPVALGKKLEVKINDTLCFQGWIAQRRMDSIDDHLSLFAIREPERIFDVVTGGLFEEMTTTGIVNAILTNTEIIRSDSYSHPVSFKKLEFAGHSLFAAIDLLAKLSGNWYWDFSDTNTLSFRPPSQTPDHTIFLKDDLHTVNLWESTKDVVSTIEIQGGVQDGSTYESWLTIPEALMTSEDWYTKIYARPITTNDALSALHQAIIHQMTAPHYEHYVDLNGWGETIAPGSTVRFLLNDLPIFPQETIFRVKMRELTFAHENFTTRLHLTSTFESSPTYFHYLRRDRSIPKPYLGGGPFQLDVSALDSPAHLDVGV